MDFDQMHETRPDPDALRLRGWTLLCLRNRRAEDQGIAMSLTTPMTTGTLQRKLYTKAKPEFGACLGVKNIGKPCAGKPHARFDEGGQW